LTFLLTLMISAFLAVSETHTEADSAGEGVVNVYTARHYDTDDALYERFTAETGIRVNVVEGKSDELIARLQREGSLSPADVFITVDAGRLWRAEQADLFAPIRSEVLEVRVPESLRHPEGLWFGITKRARVLVVSERVAESDTPTSYAELTGGEWQGRVLIRSSSNIYNQSLLASMIEASGVESTQRWAEGIVANMARRPQGGDTDQIRAVAAGEGDVAVVNHYYLARLMNGSDADRAVAGSVRAVFPNQEQGGTHVNISGAGVLADAPNRENAVRFVEFLVSDEAQRVLAIDNNEFPVVPGIALSETLSSFGDFRQAVTNMEALGRNNPEAVRVMDRAGWR